MLDLAYAQVVTYYDDIEEMEVVCVRSAPGEPFDRYPNPGDGDRWTEKDFTAWDWVMRPEVIKTFSDYEVSRTPYTPGPWRQGEMYKSVVSDYPTGVDDLGNMEAYGGHLVCESVESQGNRNLIIQAPTMAGLLKTISGYTDFLRDEGLGEEVRDVLLKVGYDL